MTQLPLITNNIAPDADQVMTIDSRLSNEINENGHTLTVFEQPSGKLSINYKAFIPATGILTPNGSTSSGINVVYQVYQNDEQISNVKVRYTNIATSTVVFEEDRGGSLFGTSTATNLSVNSRYLVEIVVNINGQEVILDAKIIATQANTVTY